LAITLPAVLRIQVLLDGLLDVDDGLGSLDGGDRHVGSFASTACASMAGIDD
jgi:hypothetical protein